MTEELKACPFCGGEPTGRGFWPFCVAAVSADLTAVRCQCCATEYPHDSYDAGFIAGSGMCQVCDAAMPPKDLPAAGSADLPPPDFTLDGGSQPCYYAETVQRIVAALSAQQSAPPEFCCELSYKAAKQKAWNARRIDRCKCDHNEYCDHCFPEDFRPGGKWHGGFVAQQSAHVSVPTDAELVEMARKLGALPELCYAEDHPEIRWRIRPEVRALVRALLNGGEA